VNRTARAIALSLTLAFALTACSGGGHAGSALPATTQPTSGGSVPTGSTTFAWGADAPAGASYVGPANVGTMGVNVAMQLQNADGLVRYAAAASTPGSASYRHFLTPQQIGAQYGASNATVSAVAAYFAGYGLRVASWPQHLTLFVSGPQHALEQAFGTSFGIYKAGGTTFIAPHTTPHFAHALPVTAVTRLVTAARLFRTFVPVSGGAITTSGYGPQQIRNVFDYTGAYSAGYTGTGISVGIVGTGPISSADVPAYGAMFSTNVAPVTQVNVTDTAIAQNGIETPPDSGFQTPPPVTAPCAGSVPACNTEDGEAQIDTEAAASLAPGSQVLFYLGYLPGYCVDSNGNLTQAPCAAGTTPVNLIGLDVADDELEQAIADDKADVMSLSFGGPEQAQVGLEFGPANDPTNGLMPTEMAALAAEGIAVFVSSGDAGAEGCQRPAFQAAIDDPCVSYPATDPSVTAVGGVNAPVDRFGNLTNQITGWGLETSDGQGGSGGGVSAYFPASLTPWQVGMPNEVGTTRDVPDDSLLGDPETGMAMLANAAFGAQVEDVGGTSVAAPEMAAMWALVLQACSSSASCATAQGPKSYRLGNAAPLLYGIYAKNGTVQSSYASTFYDVLYGDNQQIVAQPGPTSPPLDPGYNAGPNYDLVSGIGVPFARALIKAVTNQ
jgi:kumamolisin